MELRGKVALVTGGAHRVGKAIVLFSDGLTESHDASGAEDGDFLPSAGADQQLAEVVVTTGVLGTALLLTVMGGLLRRLRTVFRSGGRTETRAAGLAALGILLAVVVHELFDFGLGVPANAVAFSVLVGVACGSAVGKATGR